MIFPKNLVFKTSTLKEYVFGWMSHPTYANQSKLNISFQLLALDIGINPIYNFGTLGQGPYRKC